jgi:transcriptional regulator with XRE-family HTH domain
MSNLAEVFPPGDFLQEELDARGWSQTELAEIMGRPVRLINEIIAGKRTITPETAVQLGDSLGTVPRFGSISSRSTNCPKFKLPTARLPAVLGCTNVFRFAK